MSTRNISGVKRWPAREADNLTPFVNRLPRKCGILDISHPCGHHGLLPSRELVMMDLIMGGWRSSGIFFLAAVSRIVCRRNV
jgi:hypothetical protein